MHTVRVQKYAICVVPSTNGRNMSFIMCPSKKNKNILFLWGQLQKGKYMPKGTKLLLILCQAQMAWNILFRYHLPGNRQICVFSTLGGEKYVIFYASPWNFNGNFSKNTIQKGKTFGSFPPQKGTSMLLWQCLSWKVKNHLYVSY